MAEFSEFNFSAGDMPMLVSMPHVGTDIPDEIAAQMCPVAQTLADTDWHLPLLYNMLAELGVSCISARYSRYVIDLNRPPENTNLYPGQDTTGLLPIDTFDKQALYPQGQLPDQAETERRIALYWQPYHQQLQAELQRLKQKFGRIVLWDAHSIAAVVPRFFAGQLPDLNFGTADGAASDAGLSQALLASLQNETALPYSYVFNGRFKGGHITRHYGQPEHGIHGVQLEMSQRIYMNETAPYQYRADLASQVQPILRNLIQASLNWVRT